MCAITMVFNSSWKPLFHIEVTAAEEDGGKEEGKRLRGGGDWTIFNDNLMKNQWGRHYWLQLGPDPYAAPDGGWGWVVMIARSRKTSTTAKINILNFFLTPQTSSPSLQIMFLNSPHIRQKEIFLASSVTWRWTGSPTHSGFSSSLWWNILNWKRRDQSLW